VPEYNLGTASGQIRITSDTRGVDSAEAALARYRIAARNAGDGNDDLGDSGRRGEDGIRRVGVSAAQAGAAVSTVGKVTVAAGAGIVGALGFAVKTAADFEQGLSGIKAVSGATAEQMDLIRAAALRIGRDTAFSSSEAADAISELAKAGVPVKDILNGAADATVALAAAGGVSLPEAATIASNALNQFGLSAKELPKVADQIAGSANASAIDVGQFGQSLAAVGAVAHLAGLSFADTNVAIAELGNAGIVGSDAGTSLKTMFSSLQPSTKQAADEFKALNLITADGTNKFYDQTGKLKPLAQIQQTLQESLKGMSSAQKQAALQTIFGSDAIRAAAVLSENGAAGYNKLSTAINKTSAADVAKTRLDNLNGSVQALGGSFELVAINIGSVLLPVVRQIVDGAAQILNAFSGLPPGVQAAIAVIGVISGVLLIVGGAFLYVAGQVAIAVTALGGVSGIVGILGGVFAALTGPVALAVAAIVGIGTALALFFTQTQLGRDIIANVVSYVQTSFGNLQAFLAPIFAAIGAAVVDFASRISTGFQAAVAAGAPLVAFFQNNVLPVIQPAIQAIIDAVATLGPALTENFAAAGTAVGGFISFFQTNVGPVISGVFDFLRDAIQQAVDAIGNAWLQIQPIVQPVVDFFVSTVAPQLGGVLQGIGVAFGILAGIIGVVLLAPIAIVVAAIIALVAVIGGIVTVVGAVANFIAGAIPAIGSVFSTVFGAIGSYVSTSVNNVRSVVSTVIGAVSSFISGALNTIRSVFSTVFQALSPIVTPAMNSIRSIINSVLTIVKALVQAGLFAVRTVFSTVFGALVGIVTPPLNAARSAVSSVVNAIRSVVTSVFGAVRSFVTTVFSAIQSAISGPIRTAQGAVSSAVNTIRSAVSSAFNSARSTVTSIMSAIGNAVSTGINRVVGFFTGLGGRITGALSGIANSAFSAGASIVGHLISGLLSGLRGIADAAARVAQAVKNALPHSPAKEGPFSGAGWTAVKTSGEAIVRQFGSGIIGARDRLAAQVHSVARTAAAALSGVASDLPTLGVTSSLAYGAPTAGLAGVAAQLLAGSTGSTVTTDGGRTLVYNNYGSQGFSAEEDLHQSMTRARVLVPGW
jgi:TP901 family phage tail tape measure protein